MGVRGIHEYVEMQRGAKKKLTALPEQSQISGPVNDIQQNEETEQEIASL
jgi:hypothetical protein